MGRSMGLSRAAATTRRESERAKKASEKQVELVVVARVFVWCVATIGWCENTPQSKLCIEYGMESSCFYANYFSEYVCWIPGYRYYFCPIQLFAVSTYDDVRFYPVKKNSSTFADFS
jgi:hypothetical protein